MQIANLNLLNQHTQRTPPPKKEKKEVEMPVGVAEMHPTPPVLLSPLCWVSFCANLLPQGNAGALKTSYSLRLQNGDQTGRLTEKKLFLKRCFSKCVYFPDNSVVSLFLWEREQLSRGNKHIFLKSETVAA